MPREGHEPELSERAALAEIERELQTALSLSPPPGFEARVRRRIEEGRRVRSRRWDAFLPIAATATLVMVTALAAIIMVHREVGAPVPRTPQIPLPPDPAFVPRSHAGLLMPHPPPASRALPVERARPAHRRALRRALDGRAATEPEVIVAPGQAEAVRRLMVALAEGKLKGVPLPGTAAGAPEPLPVEPLTIEPIVVSAVDDRAAVPPVVRLQ